MFHIVSKYTSTKGALRPTAHLTPRLCWRRSRRQDRHAAASPHRRRSAAALQVPLVRHHVCFTPDASRVASLSPWGCSFPQISTEGSVSLHFSALLEKRIEFTAEHRADEGSVFLCHIETQNSLLSGEKNRCLMQRNAKLRCRA